MKNIRFLLVEDNAADIDEWKRQIERREAISQDQNSPRFNLTTASSLLEASDKIDSQTFDVAVVDLRLSSHGESEMDSSGNIIIEKLLNAQLAAVAAFTGEPDSVIIPDHAISICKAFRKGGDDDEGITSVWQWIDQQTPMILAIREAEQTIHSEMARFFVSSIWPRWNNWLENDDDSPADKEFLPAAIARHLTAHVYASLLDQHKQRAHPEEWFVVPPIHAGVRTGDIILTPESGLEIVITPRCDLATGKLKTIQLARCEDIGKEWDKLVEDRANLRKAVNEHKRRKENDAKNISPDQTKELAKQIESLNKTIGSTDNKIASYKKHKSASSIHFLPQMRLSDGTKVGPLLIQFDNIRSVSPDRITETILNNRIASVASEFVPSIVERLGAFFSRIGTPDYSDIE